MMELKEIEELIKTVNRNAIKALLRNAAIMKDPNSTPELRAQAEANVKAISYNKPLPKPPGAPRQKKVKAAAAEQATQLVQSPLTQTPAAAVPPQSAKLQPNVKLKYSPAYQHYGVSQEHWDKAQPDAHQALFAHHNEVMGGKHPDLMHIKSAVEAAKPKMIKKSLEQLFDLFSELKKRL